MKTMRPINVGLAAAAMATLAEKEDFLAQPFKQQEPPPQPVEQSNSIDSRPEEDRKDTVKMRAKYRNDGVSGVIVGKKEHVARSVYKPHTGDKQRAKALRILAKQNKKPES